MEEVAREGSSGGNDLCIEAKIARHLGTDVKTSGLKGRHAVLSPVHATAANTQHWP